MGFWDFEEDDLKTIMEHTTYGTPDSIRQEAEQEALKRGVTRDEIFEYQCRHDD